MEYLVEVCDPSEAAEFGYTVNDILVSDFYTPRFFDPAVDTQARYSFTGAITKPRQVLRGGYVSWHDPVSNHWWQQTWFGQRKEFRDLGEFDVAKHESLRAWIDARPNTPGSTRASRRATRASRLPWPKARKPRRRPHRRPRPGANSSDA